ncbi:MAG: VIT domain-containing protein [Xanthomonadales bacterium]
MPKPFSIRDRLESDAWRRHPDFAAQMARRTHAARERRALRWEDRILLILAALLMLLLIVRVETAQAADDFYGIEFGDETAALRAVALNTAIDVEVTGLLARVTVTQVFRNTGPDWAEARYRFPLPEGAAVDRLLIEAGGRLLEGEIREKTDARRTYQQARDAGRVASLVEQQRANQFQTRLANIAAGEEIRVSIGFLARVDFSDGAYGLDVPLTFTPRFTPADRGTGRLHWFLDTADSDGGFLQLEVRLNTGLQLARIESGYHDIDILPTPEGYRITLVDPDTRSDRVFTLRWTPEFGTAPEAVVTTWDGADATYALAMLTPPLAAALAPQPREVVFVIDTSGSMAGASLEQAVAALRQGLGFLDETDWFNLIAFDSEARLLFAESLPATPLNRDRAERFLAGLEADGGTEMQPALDLAMGLPPSDPLRQIVFITDGSVGNERDLLLRIGERLNDSRLFTVSIGAAPNAWFMRKAAVVGRGSHTHIGRADEVAPRMAALWARIEHPALQNVCIDWGMDAEFYPEIIPDLYAGEPLWLYARLPRAPREVLVCGELDGRPWETAARVATTAGSDAIATLWARHKIEALEDGRLFGADADAVRHDVLDIALEFGLLTRYTALVAVDRTPARPADAALVTREVPNLLPAGGTFVSGFSQTAAGWKTQLGLSALSLLVAFGMLLNRVPGRSRRQDRGAPRGKATLGPKGSSTHP